MSFVNYFKENYYEKLKTPTPGNPVRDRSDSMLKVFELLESKNKKNIRIIETGTIRPDHGNLCFGDDGCSTIIFDDFITRFNNNTIGAGDSLFHSVDINEVNCEYAAGKTGKYTIIHQSDSVKFLSDIYNKNTIDLLYLDSYDVQKGNYHDSSLHHLMELTAAMNKLTKESIIVIDDYDAFFDGGKTGKGVYVKQFLDKIGANIIFSGYQLVFQLP